MAGTARAVALKAVSDVATRAAGLITFPLLARYTGSAGYGAYAQLTTIVAFVVPFATLGLGNSMTRFFAAGTWNPLARRSVARVGLTVVLFSAAVTAAFALAAPALNAALLQWSDGDRLFRWGSLLILVGAVEMVLLDLMRARGWLTAYSGYAFTQACLGTLVVVGLVPIGYGVVAVVQALIAVRAAALAAFVLWVSRKRSDPGTAVPAATLGRMMRFGAALIVVGLGLWLMNLGDRLVVGHVLGASRLGLYSAAYAVASLQLLVNAALGLPAYPRIVRAVVAKPAGAVADEVRLFHRYITLTLIPVVALLCVLVSPGVRVLGGSDFRLGAFVGPILALGMFLDQWNALAHYVLIAHDQAGWLQRAWMVGGLANLGLNFAIVPLFGLTGAATVTLVTFTALEAAVLRKAQRFEPVAQNYALDASLRSLAASMPSCAAAVALLHLGLGTAVASGLAAAAFLVVYLLSALALRLITRADVDVVVGIVRRSSDEDEVTVGTLHEEGRISPAPGRPES